MFRDDLHGIDFWSIDKFAKGRSVWYVGNSVDLDQGITNLYNHLEVRGHILIDKPQIVDTLGFIGVAYNVCYVIYFKSLSKLEYLEYMYQKKARKHG